MAMSKGKRPAPNKAITMSVLVRAENVVQVGQGLYALHLTAREIEPAERAVLNKLFPNLVDRAYDLIAQEALLNALADGMDEQEVEALRNGKPYPPVEQDRQAEDAVVERPAPPGW